MTRQILIVEDTPEYRESIKFFFRNDRYHFIEATSPEEGITELKQNPELRVVLLDLDFGEQAGRGTLLLDYVKECGNRHRVVVLTAHEELLEAGPAEQYQVFNYLPKSGQSQAIRFSLDQAFKELEREQLVQKNKYLLEVQRKISSNVPLQEILNFICDAVRGTVDAYNCHIRVYDFERGDFRLEGFSGLDDSIRQLFVSPRAKGHVFSGQVVKSGKSRAFGRLQKLKKFRDYADPLLRSRNVTDAQRRYLEQVESAYIVPIRTGLFQPGVDAVLNVSSAKRDFFDTTQKGIVGEFVMQAELAIAKNWLQMKRDEVQDDYNQISQMLSDISDSLRHEDPKPAIYDIVTERISAIVDPEVVSIFLLNETTGRLQNVAELRGGEQIHDSDETYEPGQSLTGSVFYEDETIHIPAWGDPNRKRPTADRRYDRGKMDSYLKMVPSGKVEHYLGVPIRMLGKPTGVLRALNKKSKLYSKDSPGTPGSLLDRGFSDDCKNAMEIVANHLAVAIRNADLFRQKERQIEQIRTMGEVGRLIESVSDINEVLKVTIGNVAKVMQAEVSMLFLKTASGDRVILRESFGIPDTLLPNAYYELGQNETGKVAATGIPKLLRYESIGKYDGKYDPEIRAFLQAKYGRDTEIETVMIVPIGAVDNILGVMKVINKKGHIPYTEEDLEWFKTLAAYVGVAIENTRTHIQKRNAALSSLVSAVAHEINNTSGLIPANVRGIRNRLNSSDEKIYRHLDLIERVATQATDFANEIAGFGARRRGDASTLDIDEVIETALEDLPDYDEDNFHIEKSFSREPLFCKIWRYPFIQIVRNIVINAIQATQNTPGGLLHITTFKGGGIHTGSAILTFKDNGLGISTEHLSEVFNPDFTTKPTGNGLGLWLVKTQLEQIGGTIIAESEPGKGASFIITVPLATEGGVA